MLTSISTPSTADVAPVGQAMIEVDGLRKLYGNFSGGTPNRTSSNHDGG